MAHIDSEKLLIEDYDLHHYDFAGGFLSRPDDADKDAKDSFVVVHHFWARERAARDALVGWLKVLATRSRALDVAEGVQSCGVLRECNDLRMSTLWVRTRTEADFRKYQESEIYQSIVVTELKAGGKIVDKTELHKSQTFNGHIDKTPAVQQIGNHEINFGKVRG